jgi:hypothetical protein
VIKAGVAEVLIDEEALGALDAAAEELDEVLVLHLADELHLVEELVGPLPRVEEEPLHGDLPAICQHTLSDIIGGQIQMR